MKVLGMDTSGYANAVGVTDGGRVLADYSFEARNDSLQRILADIDFVLKSAGQTLEDIDGLGVGLGPGSWTGIRVGVTVDKMLALATGKPVAGVSTLEALAAGAADYGENVCAVVDAGARGLVYAACYRVGDGGIVRDGEYYVGEPSGLAAILAGTVTLAAENAARQLERLTPYLDGVAVKVTAAEVTPSGAVIARLAGEQLVRGQGDDALSLTPLYLKESTAKVFRNKYLGRS